MMLDVRDLSFCYGEKPALLNVSLSMDKGEILCVMGPNGSGKSTLIECIMGMNRIEEGMVFLSGRDVRSYSRSETAALVSYVPQNHAVTFPYTVREVVMMGRTAYLSAFGTPPEGDEKYADEAMERVGISPLADKPYSLVSGGELRLVILARALCQNAPLILMDEPTAHLDYRNEISFLEIVSELCAKDGISVLMATHDPGQAFYFESKGLPVSALFLKEGRVFAKGSPGDVITSGLLEDVYKVKAKILEDESGKCILLKGAL